MIVLLSRGGLSAQTWQRVIDYIPNTVNGAPIAILPAVDGGVLVITSGFLVKFDADGDTLWTKTLPDSLSNILSVKTDPNGTVYLLVPDYGPDTVVNHLATLNNAGDVAAVITVARNYDDFCATGDGFLLARSNYATTDTTLRLLRINLAGDTLWYQEHAGPYPMSLYVCDVIQTSDGGFLASITEDLPDNTKRQRVIKTDSNGVMLWTSNAVAVDFAGLWNDVVLEEPDGSFVWIGSQYITDPFYAIRLSASGEMLLTKSDSAFNAPYGFVIAPDGGFWITGMEVVAGLGQLYIRKLDHDFNVEWTRLYAPSPIGTLGKQIAHSGGNSYTILGGFNIGQKQLPYVIHPDSLGNILQNLIEGQLRHDLDDNCVADTTEPGLANWLVSTGVNFTLTDSLGKFEVYGDAGGTPVHVFPPMAYWEVCPGFDTVIFTQLGDTAYLQIPASQIAECPYPEISISTGWTRPCFESIYDVRYCNLGTAAADTAWAIVVFPPEISFVTATIPVMQQSGDTLWFDLGTLDIGECGNFKVTGLIDCDPALIGQTVCVEAYIFPDTLCFPATNWSGAEVMVSAQCINDQEVKFAIRNIGVAPTASTLNYLIIEDQVVLRQDTFQLDAGSVMEFTEPADGSYWRISADQEIDFPAPSMPVAWVEGCGGFQSLGYVDDYFFDDASSRVDIDCHVLTSSYDPNDKQAFPEGYGDEHFIEPETELTFLIRFQNTGTDTAFNVILRDTLDAWLDPTSLRPGASSHPYEFDLVGPGVLKIWFKNILLPDSNVNEAASHGFFQYRVKLNPDVPLGTLIHNRAAIYFDFNAPVLTNQTFHTVGKNYYTVSVEDVRSETGAILKVAPNPFGETTRLTMENAEGGVFDLYVYDIRGKQIRHEVFAGSEMVFRREGLATGIYFFEVRQNGRRVVMGKMIAK